MDPICRRVLGVLVEKELTVPDSYPLTENSVLTGANQKSNRDPEMALSSEDVRRALDTLRAEGWASRVEAPGARTRKWRHHFESQLGVDDAERAILVELLLRGPQAPGALKPRVKRLGLEAEPERIRQILERLQERKLVERQARRPRERDERWAQLMGPGDTADAAAGLPEAGAAEGTATAAAAAGAAGAAVTTVAADDVGVAGVAGAALSSAPSPSSPAAPAPAREVDVELLERRVAALEREYARLRARLGDGPE